MRGVNRMADYMDKQTAANLLDNLVGMVDDSQENDYDTALKMGIEALKADVQPVRHGHWIYTPTSPLGFTCSECGKEMCRFNYCPHCGVRMDEVTQ